MLIFFFFSMQLVVCRPDLTDRKDSNGKDYKYNNIRMWRETEPWFSNMLNDENNPSYQNWHAVAGKVSAITQRDADREQDGSPMGDRKRIPETITLHPLLVKFQGMNSDFNDQDLSALTAPGALDFFKGQWPPGAGFGPVPVDQITDELLPKLLFHEVCTEQTKSC
jgi:hypothetical protein